MRKKDLLLVLAGNDTQLASAEAELLLGEHAERDERLCRIRSREAGLTRLAYTREAHEILHTCQPSQLEANLRKIRINETTFLARTHRGITITGGMAGSILKENNPASTVELTNPKGQYHVFSFNGMCCITRLIWRNDEDFNGRRSHLRPGGCPISLHPRLARCMVNLTGAKQGTIIDPCCGTGGMLIEAGLMGLHPVGFDIEQDMIARSQKALEHFNIPGRIAVKDCRDIRQHYRYLVTDIPYGRNTAPTHRDFIPRFMDMLSRVVTQRAVISAASEQKIPIPANCGLLHEFPYYIHKSLTKKLYVIDIIRKHRA
mgnify:CR=1 FL=1